ncbi:MAG: hypothetical protein HLUCCX14_12780 [Marinobacter excellens HL-55]|uniref:Uncharacterized protein n=1 Tax=Marinobacter excellens HL-55 TaxID=1305731 RepID=A0A0P7YC78_9GAMM|nr:MAG: hypothetical protein HLUCCX14_12780 [Marinobacter excellens HL-55]
MTTLHIMRAGRALAILSLLGLNGCASYHTHYAMFPAETSGGETRQVRVSWQSAEYPDWWIVDDKATPIRLETQCSERVWRITDPGHGEAGACSGDVRACGDAGQDLIAVTGQPATTSDVCLLVQSPAEIARVADIGASFSLLVSCEPANATVQQDGEVVNVDYLRPSSVAYTIRARKVPRGSLSARLPEFNQNECKED